MISQLDALDRALGRTLAMLAIELDRVTLARARTHRALGRESSRYGPANSSAYSVPTARARRRCCTRFSGLLRPSAGELQGAGRGARARQSRRRLPAAAARVGRRPSPARSGISWRARFTASVGALPLTGARAGAKWTGPSRPSRRRSSRRGRCASSRAASSSGCCWRKRCSASRSCFCSTSRCSASTRISSRRPSRW